MWKKNIFNILAVEAVMLQISAIGNVWIIWIPHSFVNISPRLLAALVIMVPPLFCQTSQLKLEPIMWHHSIFRGSEYVAFIALMLAYILYACISLYICIVFA